jgi:CRISPR-associated endonuclease/helicase Cas3
MPTPFAFVIMSATPPPGTPSGAVFPGAQRSAALNDLELERRFRTRKLAELVALDEQQTDGEDPLVREAVERARRFLGDGKRRIAVMLNRVRTAEAVAQRLLESCGQEAEILLLTGRLRPLERDDLVQQWERYLRANKPQTPQRPIIVVTTQCLEVGADFSFGALVTECASLDALRQRFGRLARLGSGEPASGAILVRKRDVDSKKPDWLYGEALARTWQWLQGEARWESRNRPVVEMGIEHLDKRLQAMEDLSELLAPSARAPILLPAHLDLLCQTAPSAHPEPDVSLLLHGRTGPPDVFVAWRCDLDPKDTENWVETVALCPPVTNELLQAPLWRVRAWLADQPTPEDAADIEGLGPEAEGPRDAIRPCLLWRGRDRSRLANKAEEIMPREIVVVPASYGMQGLGQATRAKAVGSDALDLWEAARAASGLPAAVRLTRVALAPWISCPPVKDLMDYVSEPVRDPNALQERIQALLDYIPANEQGVPGPPLWWSDLLREVRFGRVLEHPSGGIVLMAPNRPWPAAEPDLFSDEDDLTSAADQPVPLEQHCRLVQRAAAKLAERCLPEEVRVAVELAAVWHDAGKLDPRFQLLLRHGDEVAVAAAETPIAKSELVAASPWLRQRIRQASGLPENFRHEMVSVELANKYAELPADGILRDLVLHLIASHHGYARPFAPVANDPHPPAIFGTLLGREVCFSGSDRKWCAHRLGSGVAERFWRLTRHFGWWGLAYLEAILRLADWYASNFTLKESGP